MTNLLHWPLILLSYENSLNEVDKAKPMLELLGIFLIFCCVLYLAYIASRFIGKKFSNANHSKYMKVVDRISLGVDRQLLLIKIGTEYYLFMYGKRDFKMVAKVAIDDKEDTDITLKEKEHGDSAFDFREIFDKYLNRNAKKSKRSSSNDGSLNSTDKTDTLKENINKLKQMQEKGYDKEV